MQARSKCSGQVVYDYDEFCRDYGHPSGQCFTLEVTRNAVTYVYAQVIGEVYGDRVIFDLTDDDLVSTRKAH